MLLEEFDYFLPPELIATEQIKPRDHAKLLALKSNKPEIYLVKDIINFLEEGDIVVLNNTKVLPAKLEAITSKGIVSFNLHKMTSQDTWLAFAKPSHKLSLNQELTFGDDFKAIVIDKSYGEITLKFFSTSFIENLHKYGKIPLPPYIEKKVGTREQDKEDYQTIFAKHSGSIAAPTAGLHFTEELLNNLSTKGVKIASITLHVGAGTFLPIKTSNIEDHKMHSEYGVVSENTAKEINNAKQQGHKILAIGTTTARLLETACKEDGKLQAFEGETDIFIKPGYNFKVVDILMTNFHLPKSTLLMLVSAFVGHTEIMNAYDYAIKNNLRFYSYGDASLLYKKEI
jgi:S-adenosylmethionine:tRNA ribosyltransferase-isomerase